MTDVDTIGRNPYTFQSPTSPAAPVSADVIDAPATKHTGAADKHPMKKELNRCQSYFTWPSKCVTPEALAKDGFFYMQKADLVKCAFCSLELGKWEAGDVPSADHRTWSPRCPLVEGRECGNVRMSDSERNSLCASNASDSDEPTSFDTCGRYGIHVRPHSGPENGRAVDVQRYAVKHTSTHPQYAFLEERMQSFHDWPVSIKQRPQQLAEAGFYYSGKSDQTICYSCGGGLKAWEETDDPWEQHASWFPLCSFLRLHKTDEYIAHHNKTNNEKGRLPPVPSTSSAGAPKTPILSLNSTQATTSTTTTTTAPIAEVAATKDNPNPNQPVNLCKICYTNEIGVVFLPCGHMVACVECAPALTKCAVCRRELEATVRAFLS